MRNFSVLTVALEYIEEHICEQFRLETLAKECSVSLSGLHKLFGYAFGYSVRDYIQKRRHSLACRDLAETDMSILEIALKYGYNSHEVFARAFMKIRGETPSAFRKHGGFADLFPKLELNMGGNDMRKVDISDLYEEIKKLRGSFVLCADIISFKAVNDDFGFTSGDIVLTKTAERITGFLDDNMMFFRIGRDEFVALTGYFERNDAVALAEKITALNGQEVSAGDNSIPLSLRIGVTKIPDRGLSYTETLQSMQETIDEARRNNSSCYCRE